MKLIKRLTVLFILTLFLLNARNVNAQSVTAAGFDPSSPKTIQNVDIGVIVGPGTNFVDVYNYSSTTATGRAAYIGRITASTTVAGSPWHIMWNGSSGSEGQDYYGWRSLGTHLVQFLPNGDWGKAKNVNITFVSPDRSPNALLWDASYFSPASPADSQAVTLNFNKNNDVNVINLRVDGQESGTYQTSVPLDRSGAFTVTFPANHPAHTIGTHTLGIHSFYCNGNNCIAGPISEKTITIVSDSQAKNPGVSLWDSQFFQPDNPGKDQNLTINFNRTADTNYVNLVIDGVEYGGSYQKVFPLGGGASQMTFPANHPAHTPGTHTVGVKGYYCNPANLNDCKGGDTSARSMVVRDPSASIWDASYAQPANPTDDQEITLNFNKNADANFINLRVDGQEYGAPYQTHLPLGQTGPFSIKIPANHPRHTIGTHTIGIHSYYCNESNNNECVGGGVQDKSITISSTTSSKNPSVSIWDEQYFNPMTPGNSQDVTINFNRNGDVNYVNLVIDGTEYGGSYQKAFPLSPGASTIIFPANHVKHVVGSHSVGIKGYYCDPANNNECKGGGTSTKNITITSDAETKNPSVYIWDAQYFNPASPSDSQNVTINFNRSEDVNYVNLVVDGQEYGAPYQTPFPFTGGASSVTFPANHEKHTPGNHTLGVKGYYCNPANNNECKGSTTSAKSITILSDTDAMNPSVSIWDAQYFEPAAPTDNQSITINFNRNAEVNYVNLVIDDKEYGAPYQKQFPLSPGASTIIFPADHEKHTVGAHKVGIKGYYCNPKNTNECKAGGTSTKTVTITAPANPTATPIPTTAPTVTPSNTCPLRAKGDANCDGNVDLIDFQIWRSSFGRGA